MPLFIYEELVEKNVEKIIQYTNRQIMAVVKNDAYGLNVKKMIPILKKASVNFFVFEKYCEYLECQDMLKKNRVLILESVDFSHIQIIPQNVAFSINSIIDAIKLKTITQKIKVHLQIDTGMNRIGIRSIDEAKKIINILEKHENIKIEGIYTHFSSDVFESKYYERQVKDFKKYLKLCSFSIIHANATKSLHKEIIGNYVRVGMALYGYHQPYLKLHRTVSLNVLPCHIFRVQAKDRISYAQQKVGSNIIGVLPFGYADFDLDGIKNIYANGQKYPIVGKNCMHHTHFIASDKINYLSWLSIFPTNGIIVTTNDYNYNLNWYHILTSLDKMPKNYIRRSNYDLPSIFKYHGEKSLRTKFRKRSD